MKSLLLSLTEGLYKKVKDYADDNGISIVGAIRLIINQFFKDNKKI